MLSEGLKLFLADRRLRNVAEKEIATLERKILDFCQLIGDRPVGAYSISDLQQFANHLIYLPERHKLDRHWKDKTIKEIIEANRKRVDPMPFICVKRQY